MARTWQDICNGFLPIDYWDNWVPALTPSPVTGTHVQAPALSPILNGRPRPGIVLASPLPQISKARPTTSASSGLPWEIFLGRIQAHCRAARTRGRCSCPVAYVVEQQSEFLERQAVALNRDIPVSIESQSLDIRGDGGRRRGCRRAQWRGGKNKFR